MQQPAYVAAKDSETGTIPANKDICETCVSSENSDPGPSYSDKTYESNYI